MPLPAPNPRELLTRRTITSEGYLRDDGLVDIEGHLVDVRGYDTGNEWRGPIAQGEPVHEMWLRLTVDDDLTIRGVACATDAAPHPPCREVPSNMERLVGLVISGGFKKQVRQKVGGTEGCTHILAMIDAMSAVAVHALAGKRRGQGRDAVLGAYGGRGGQRNTLIDSCHAYAADSPVVKVLWPEAYRPKSGPPSN